MAQFTIFALIIQMISSNPSAYHEACSDPLVFGDLLCADDVDKGIYHLYMYHQDILRKIPFLVEEQTIAAIKQALAMKDHAWRDYGRTSIEDIANNVRIELSGRPIISFR